MTHKSRIYAPIDTNPLPEYDCKIDVKLNCGSTLIGAIVKTGYGGTMKIIYWIGQKIDESQIKSWRLSK